jgi:hypothetical protein
MGAGEEVTINGSATATYVFSAEHSRGMVGRAERLGSADALFSDRSYAND